MTEAADGETGRPPAPRRAPWEMRDLIVLGVAAAVAAVVALIAQYGGVPKAQPLVGLIVILGIAYAFSTNRRAISLNTVAWGLGLQILFALIVLKTTVGRAIFQAFGAGITKILDFAFVGGSFVFGPLGDKKIWPEIMNKVLGPAGAQWGVVFAFQVLPTIIFVAMLTSVLYYLGILQAVVRGMAWLMAKLMGSSGAESLSNTANIFVGQTEAPLFIRPYVSRLTQSELHAVMVGGFATIAAGVMAVYISFGVPAVILFIMWVTLIAR